MFSSLLLLQHRVPSTEAPHTRKSLLSSPQLNSILDSWGEDGGSAGLLVYLAVRWQDLTRGDWQDRLFFPVYSTQRLASGRVGHFSSAVMVTSAGAKIILSLMNT